MHNVVIRHIAVIVPVMMLIQGIGVSFLYDQLKQSFQTHLYAKFLIIALLSFHFIAGTAIPFVKKNIYRQYNNTEYSIDILKEPIKIVNEFVKSEKSKLVTIAARKTYLAYYADAKYINIPYTTYEKLVKYCEFNNIDFLFLQHRMISSYPFLKEFLKSQPPSHFSLLYSIEDKGYKIELYLVK